MAESEQYKVFLSKAMALCASREMCSSDIRKKLELWGIDDLQAEKIIDRLKSEIFIDDSRFASAFVKDKFRYNKWGKIKINSHLRMKRIPDKLIQEALESIDKEVYLETIKSILATHKKSVKAKNNYDLKAKLLRFGLSKGFESNILYDILSAIEEG
jgi:regulatory protein